MRYALLLALLPFAASAQTFERAVAPFPVTAEGEAIPYPFAGGFFEPRPTLVDLDADGDADLIVNVGGAGLQYFERDGGDLHWRTDRLGGFEPGNWHTFGDLDGDGDLDLLTRGEPGRVRVWQNVGTAQAPAFEVIAEGLVTTDSAAVTIEDSSIPTLADVDGDGDPDLLSGKADIGTITYYRHDGADAAGVPQFTFVTDAFQDIQIYEENPQCTDAAFDGIGAATLPAPRRMTTRHGANALAIVDLTGDDAPELFWGDFFSPSLFYYRNTGTPTEPVLVLEGDRYPVGQPLTSGGYNAPTYGDGDADGDLDLVVGTQRGLCFQSETAVANLFAFENAGSASEADFRIVTDRLIEALDIGTRTAATLGDLDADGDLDLLLGNEADPTDPSRANLVYYENVGTASAPALRLVDADYQALTYDFGAYAPALGDLDGDGDLDLLVGGFNGRFALLQNDGTPAAPAFTRVDDRFQNVDAGQYGRATLGDLDADGDLDLVTGASNGRVRLYRNTGTAAEPRFETEGRGTPSEADLAFGAEIGIPDDVGQDSAPALADLDGDGDLDLVVGTAEGVLFTYQNVGTPDAPAFEQAASVEAGRRRTVPALGDLTGDGLPDLIAGTDAGGFLYWGQTGGTWTAPPPSTETGLRVVPNPSTGDVAFRASGVDRGHVDVFDARGRKLVRLDVRAGEAVWLGPEAGTGLYLARLTTASGTASATFTRL
ncbi:MAG: VCBS repeat-containing protein [Bacteroidota bacterium]